MKKKILIFPFIIFLFVLFVFLYLLIIERDPLELPSAFINKKVPIFQANTLLKKQTFVSKNEFGNEITLVNFFATWCGPCREEHVYIRRLSNEKGLKVIGINYKDDPSKTIKWLNELGNPYSVVILDKKGNIGIDWGVYGIPETFIVNSKGIIKYRLTGPITKKKYNYFYSKIKESENQ
jgi:cytochrome c biogenesis protein CcmG/thiol:disulfide interchange protein DsbE